MKGSNAYRVWLAGGVVGAVLIAILAWFVAINPQLSDTSSLQDQTDQASTQNEVLTSQVETLKRLDANRQSLIDELKSAQGALPSASGLDDFMVEVQRLAAANVVSVQSIIASNPAAVSGAATAATAGEPSAGSAAAGTTPAKSAQRGVFSITVAINAIGDEKHLNAFIGQLQQGPRRLLITALQVSAAGNATAGNTLASAQATITAQLFVQPVSSVQQQLLDKILSKPTS